jgi:hypothetical protein
MFRRIAVFWLDLCSGPLCQGEFVFLRPECHSVFVSWLQAVLFTVEAGTCFLNLKISTFLEQICRTNLQKICCTNVL